MFNLVQVGDKTVPMLSMASTDVYFRHIFHEDPIAIQSKGPSEAEAIDMFMRLGFVMAKYAETKDRKEMLKLNEDSFMDWLDKFERNDLINALPDAQKTYDGQMLASADSKKNNTEQTGG